jgi:hypothetical protein
MSRSYRAGICALTLSMLLIDMPWSAHAQQGDPARSVGSDRVERARVYLGQSLTALGWAKRHAETAGRTSVLPGFDLARYLAELETITHGLERYLQPSGPPPGPLTTVEITGQFLLEGLRRQPPPASGPPQP